METKIDEETLNKIISAYDAYKAKAEGEPTIFSVLGRTYDEDLLSRLVLKCLLDDPGAVNRLLAFCDEQLNRKGIDKNVSISKYEGRCEQVTERLSRVDIYIRGVNESGQGFALLIENKIGAGEHDQQTKTYFRWAIQNHVGETVYCVFLKPSWNKSDCSSDEFVTVTYADIADMFTVNNRFIEELKLHITKHLEVNETMDPIIAKHSKELFEIVEDLKRKRSELAKEINQMVLAEFSGVGITEDHSPSYGVWRYYAKDLQWYDESYKYYFYIEFKIGMDGDIEHIQVQRTLKTYSQSSAKLDSFIAELNQRSERFKSVKADNRYWICAWDIKPDGDVFSPEWNLSAKEKIIAKLQVAYKEQKEIVEEFRKSKYFKQ